MARSLVGNYITSLEMQGCSITVLRLDDEMTDALGRPGAHPGPALGRLTVGLDVGWAVAVADAVGAGRWPSTGWS